MVEFYVDGKLLMTDKDAPFSFSWVPFDEPGGVHVMKIIGFSADGNAIEKTSEFYIDLAYGEPFGGGTIFYLEGNGEHGLVAASFDLGFDVPTAFEWGDNSLVGAVSRTDGVANTSKMSGRYISYAAAGLIYGYPQQGYEDWYIPSVEELLTLYKLRHFVLALREKEPEAEYWTSTEVDGDHALKVNLASGIEDKSAKNKQLRVRPIRKF
jgi:hypothetical protein